MVVMDVDIRVHACLSPHKASNATPLVEMLQLKVQGIKRELSGFSQQNTEHSVASRVSVPAKHCGLGGVYMAGEEKSDGFSVLVAAMQYWRARF
jgi:hypothetical protein